MAQYKIDVNRLDKGELSYELKIRGVSLGTVEQMRTSLTMARRMEKSGDSFAYPIYPFSAEEDVAAVRGKLDELGPMISSFSDSCRSGLFCKVQSKLYHTLHRIDHIPMDNPDRPNLLAEVLSFLEELHQKAESFGKASVVPVQLEVLRGNTSSPSPNHNGSSTPIRSEVKPILPNKWDCKFSGDRKGLSLGAFLERVEELRVARHVSKETLLASGIDLFIGKAYQFYLAYRNQVSTWDEFVALLKEEYLSANYNERLFEEIKRRTQGPDESIGVYIAVMTGYFNRLNCDITEESKLKILMRNLAPFYQNHLSLIEVSSIAELRKLGKRLEASKEAVEDYMPPTRRTSALEPDLAYVEAEPEVGRCQVTTVQSGSSKEVLCYRCNKPGHLAKGCVVKTDKFCYRCKRDGYTVRTCPQCSQAGKGQRHA